MEEKQLSTLLVLEILNHKKKLKNRLSLLHKMFGDV